MPLEEQARRNGLRGYASANLQPWIVQVIASVTALAVVAVALRLLSRRLKQQQLWWDDKMIVFSLCWYLVIVGFCFGMYSAGLGLHADETNQRDIVILIKWLVAAEVLYVWNLAWTKTSILLMYYRIFHVTSFKRVAWIVGTFVWLWVVTITFLSIFICLPVQKLWYPELSGRCINQFATWISNAVSTILTDLMILVMPLPQIWRLQLKRMEKVALTVAFGLGLLVVGASSYRTGVLFMYTNTDPAYTLAPTVGWTAIELSLGIVSACLPTLRPVFIPLLRPFGVHRRTGSRMTHNTPSFGSSATPVRLHKLGSHTSDCVTSPNEHGFAAASIDSFGMPHKSQLGGDTIRPAHMRASRMAGSESTLELDFTEQSHIIGHLRDAGEGGNGDPSHQAWSRDT